MALTTNQITLIRLQSGDCSTDKPLVSDEQIQEIYDATSSICATVIGVITARLAKATANVGVNASTGSSSGNPQAQSIIDQLDYWQANCPDAYPEMGQALLQLGIDEEIAT